MPQSREHQPEAQQQPGEAGERLESWKEIATFLGRGIRTVQRWEEVEGLPVHRHIHSRGGTVFAYKSEVQQWYSLRELETSSGDSPAPAAQLTEITGRPRWPVRVLIAGGGSLTLLTLVAVFAHSRRLPAPPEPGILISQIGRISQTVLAPNGERLVYSWNGDRESGNLDLYFRDIRTGANRRLTSHPSNEHSAAWSATGDRIAFLRDKVGVFVMPVSGGDERMVEPAVRGTVYGIGMSWSPDGQWLVFSERQNMSAPTALMMLDVRKGSRRQITSPPASSAGDLYPSFSPDGRTISCARSWPGGRSAIELLHLDESQTQIVRSEELALDQQTIAGLDWLPDGNGLVYASNRSGLRRLWQVRWSAWRRRWTEPEQMATSADGAWQPSVARQARRIIYSRRFWNTGIFRLRLGSERGDAPSLTRFIGSSGTERLPAYSPDYMHVAFVSDRSGFAQIWTCDRDGHNEKQLTFERTQPERPSWSPDSKWLAFSLRSENGEGIYVMDASGGAPRRITPAGSACSSPSWSPDGQWIYFSCSDGADQILKILAGGGALIPVTAGTRPQSGPGGDLYFIRSGELWRMPAAGGSQTRLIARPVGDYVVSQRGIYFDLGSGDYTEGIVKFYDPRQRTMSVVARLERRKNGGLAVSPDDTAMLIPINERQGSEVLALNVPSN